MKRELKCSVRQHEKCSANVCEYCGHGKPLTASLVHPREVWRAALHFCAGDSDWLSLTAWSALAILP